MDLTGISHVNRSLAYELSQKNSLNLSCIDSNPFWPEMTWMPDVQKIIPLMCAEVPENTQITVRHMWPPNLTPPVKGLWIMVQPWEYGRIPLYWVDKIQEIDEVWVPTHYVKKQFVDSGVPENKVAVIPHGIDPTLFQPEASPRSFNTHKKFKFLFVGGTVHRKGVDILLKSYLETFSDKDDVTLIIKDVGTKSFYPDRTLSEYIKNLQAVPGTPEILYLDNEITLEDMPSLYTACDCLVHPYRGEGFALPILEAMACGLPVIVTANGPSEDFVNEQFGWKIPSTVIPTGPMIFYGRPLAGDGWMLEPDQKVLSGLMHWAAEHPLECKTKGSLASEHVRHYWTWKAAADIAETRLKNLWLQNKG